MEIIDAILGNVSDPDWKTLLDGAEVDLLELDQWEAQKNRFRKATTGGRIMAVALERGQDLRDGDILDWNDAERKAVVCRVRLCPVMVVDMHGLAGLSSEEGLSAAVRLGHALGNQHWPAVVRGGMVYVPMSADRKVMASVMDTHAIPGTTCMFLAGEDVLGLLDPQEVRRLFGGAERHGHEHGDEPILRHGFGREHQHERYMAGQEPRGEEMPQDGIVGDRYGHGRGPHGRRHRCRRHRRFHEA